MNQPKPQEAARIERQLAEIDTLPPTELSSLIDIVQARIEYHRDEIARLRPILQRLQRRIPNNPFQEFLDSLGE